MFYKTDSLNALYNAVDHSGPRPKVFFDGMAFTMQADKLDEMIKTLDNLFAETGTESYVDMLDGWSLVITCMDRTKKVNTGPMLDKWKEYSIFLRDSIVRPNREVKDRWRQ
ncbi:MAG: hypothetical protein QM762_13120 [Chryseolinea sp.]